MTKNIIITPEDNILIIAPHPDDECIGAGGLLAGYSSQCTVIVMTDGAIGNSNHSYEAERKIRKEQFEKEMQYIMPKEYRWMGFADGTLMSEKECMETIRFQGYTKIFLPWGEDDHPDHTAAYIYSLKKIRQEGITEAEIYQYEVHVPFKNATHHIDITDYMEKKQAMIKFHADQMEILDYSRIVYALNKYRACCARAYDGFYECFLETKVDENSDNAALSGRELTLQKYQRFYGLLIKWLEYKVHGTEIMEYLKAYGYKNVSIYGFSKIGQLLYEMLCSPEINVNEIIDIRKLDGPKDTPLVSPEAADRDTDAVIVTAITDFISIKHNLEKLGYKNILSLEDIINHMDEKEQSYWEKSK